ncbi:MAG: ATPase [Bacteroidales bacterium]|nr:ATPase [Bacteroidales bacterium]
MKIIIDSGATKAQWGLVADGKEVGMITTAGINLATMSADAVEAIVAEAASQVPAPEKVEAVYFYAAGLITTPGEAVPQLATGLDKSFRKYFPNGKFEYASDLLAAARAVCGHSKGIACILGTGSNSCLFDGENIVRNIHSCGFILGDEGSGASLGKRFMAAFLKDLLPEEVASDFASKYEVDYLTVVKNVYRSAAPSKYLGGFAPYIISWYDRNEYVKELIEENFRDFVKGFLVRYDPSKTLPLGAIGGFAYANKAILEKVAAEEGVRFDKIYKTPIEGLIQYHA